MTNVQKARERIAELRKQDEGWVGYNLPQICLPVLLDIAEAAAEYREAMHRGVLPSELGRKLDAALRRLGEGK